MKQSQSYGEIIDLSQHDGSRRHVSQRTASPGVGMTVSAMDSSVEIDFTPHYKTLTATGKSHFSSTNLK